MGTPQYMAPEQVEGRVADADAATDQFALAVIAYEMLTGRNPFQADSVEEIFSRVSSARPMSVGLGGAVDAVLARALAKSGAQRFAPSRNSRRRFRAAALSWGRANTVAETVPPAERSATTRTEGNGAEVAAEMEQWPWARPRR